MFYSINTLYCIVVNKLKTKNKVKIMYELASVLLAKFPKWLPYAFIYLSYLYMK